MKEVIGKHEILRGHDHVVIEITPIVENREQADIVTRLGRSHLQLRCVGTLSDGGDSLEFSTPEGYGG